MPCTNVSGKGVNGTAMLTGREKPSGAASCSDSLVNGIPPGIRGEAWGNGIPGPPGIGEGGLERDIGCPSRTWPGGYTLPPNGVVERGRGFACPRAGEEEKLEPGYPVVVAGRYGSSPARTLGEARIFGLGEADRRFGEAARMFGEARMLEAGDLILLL